MIAGVIDDMGRGLSRGDAVWGPLTRRLAGNKQLHNGLAAFMNWSVVQGIVPGDVADAHVGEFFGWLETRTLCAEPKTRARNVPLLWNRAADTIEGWTQQRLATISFRPPSDRVPWDCPASAPLGPNGMIE